MCRSLQREIKKIAKTACTGRRNEQKELQKEAIKRGDKKTATAIRNKLVAENTKALFKKLRGLRGNRKTGLNKLEVPRDEAERNYKACIEWLTLDVP